MGAVAGSLLMRKGRSGSGVIGGGDGAGIAAGRLTKTAGGKPCVSTSETCNSERRT